MTLLEQIRKDRNKARKDGSKDRYDTLTVLLAESERVGKDKENRDSTDAEVVQVVKKMISVCQDTIQLIEGTSEYPHIKEIIEKWNKEIVVYENYVPEQFSETELILVINEIISIKELTQSKDMGIVMADLKLKYAGCYDGRMASNLARQMLSS